MRALLLFTLLLLTACSTAPSSLASVVPADAGTLIEPPTPVRDFSLPSNRDGAPFTLSELRGNPTMIFFGYTFCPDVCPVTLSEMQRVKAELGVDGERLNVVFISVDGERDTPEVLARYMSNFDPAFIGLQGDEATLRRIGSDYGLYYQKQAVEGTSAAYLVDHSSAAYLLDSAGQLRVVYRYGTAPTVIAEGVRVLLATE